jgi:hypothetical protein
MIMLSSSFFIDGEGVPQLKVAYKVTHLSVLIGNERYPMYKPEQLAR